MQFYKSVLSVALTLLVTTYAFAQKDSTITFKVSGACGMCEDRIEKSLKIKGVSAADWDINLQQVSVTFDPSKHTIESLQKRVADVGHDTELYKATEQDYKELPGCCLYRDIEPHTDGGAEEDHENDESNLHGVIVSEDNKGNFKPLEGANLQWLGTNVHATTDDHGVFVVPFQHSTTNLVISYTGYSTDTLDVAGMNHISLIMSPKSALKEVKVMARLRSTYVNTANPFRVSTLTSRELLKAACCNLSESFETNPSVDVSYNDAVTGAKQIQLLGLAGNYSQLTVENLPGPRGLATPLGLNTISGTWVESIQLMKGTGSVVNGFESIAGQINVELKKPGVGEKVYINGYVNSMGKSDLNVNFSKALGGRWATSLLLHDAFLFNKTDFNEDGFRDQPTGNLFAAMNRWSYDDQKGMMIQFGAKYLTDEKTGGELMHEPDHKINPDHYGVGINTDRVEGFAKIGYVFPGKKFRSIGLQLSAFEHKQDAYFGTTAYDARQTSFYSNLIYQDVLGDTRHKFKTGLSLTADKYREVFDATDYNRKEIVPGGFFEYTWAPLEKFTLVAGIRGDNNNLFGFFATPRMNVRYEPLKGTVVRISAGRGQRTANIFAENLGSFISSRLLVLQNPGGNAYGMKPEVAWNKGISVDQKLKLFSREAMFSFDYFRNDFINQVVVDVENPRFISFYNLDGKSFSNSIQGELSFTPAKSFDVRVAYRWFDVKTTFGEELKQKPLTAESRAFLNLAYELNKWKFDFTMNYTGDKRLPSTKSNPSNYQMPERSPSFITMNTQVSKAFGKSRSFELYLGAENLGNYFQEKAIIASQDPFGGFFDASLIWGPLSERLVYGGFRWKLN